MAGGKKTLTAFAPFSHRGATKALPGAAGSPLVLGAPGPEHTGASRGRGSGCDTRFLATFLSPSLVCLSIGIHQGASQSERDKHAHVFSSVCRLLPFSHSHT